MRVTLDLVAFVLLTALAIVPTVPAPRTARGEEATTDILWTGEKQYSYGNEELIIRDFFQDRRNGFFVDVGCAWPIKNSNTYYLEKNLGWSGVGVDGLPDYAASWREVRPRSAFLNFMVTTHSDSEEKFYKVGVFGLSTAEKDVAKDLAVVAEIQVPSITLDDLLERQGVTSIDLVSIDVEGHQESVLAGFDLQRWQPKLVCIEDDGPFAVAWFRARGYEPIERYRLRDIVNWYFAPRELAAAANARDTERGREERRKREALLAAEPPGSPVRALVAPMYVLGPDGVLVLNPQWVPPAAKKAAAAADPPPPAHAALAAPAGGAAVIPPASPDPTARR